MSKITITVKTKTIAITEVFDEKIHGSTKKVLLTALEWLAMGTVFEIKERKKQ